MADEITCDACGNVFPSKEIVRGTASEYSSGRFVCPDCTAVASKENLILSDSFVPAGLLRRGFAFLIDVLPITAVVFLIFYSTPHFKEVFDNFMSDVQDVAFRWEYTKMKLLVRGLSGLVYIVYAAYFESSKLRGTLGKRLLRISVVNADGRQLSRGRAINRNALKVLSALPAMLGFVVALFNKNRRTWHDSLAGTYVIDGPKSVDSPAGNTAANSPL